MMARFRKKPVVIEAVQWEGSQVSFDAILAMGLELWKPGAMGSKTFIIETLEGNHTASEGDWIIKGVAGEFYPCKPDIFVATYEPAGTAEESSSTANPCDCGLDDVTVGRAATAEEK